MAKFRQQKIDEEMKRELSFLISSLKDPRLDGCIISLTAVNVTKDLKFAKIFTSVLADDEKRKLAVQGLNSSAGFLRRELGNRMKIRYIPSLTFVLDDSIAYGTHINKIINELGISGDEDEENN